MLRHRRKTRSLLLQADICLLKFLPQRTLHFALLPLPLHSSAKNANSWISKTSNNANQTHAPRLPQAMKNHDTVKMIRSRRDKRTGMAKRGIRSLAFAVAFPLSLTLFNIYFFGPRNGAYGTVSKKPFWFPPLWALHLTCMASSFLMSLSAWLVWAEGGFHKNPTALSLYLAQLGLGLTWDPVVFWMGATWMGLVVCLATFGALVGCSRQFRDVNPIAGDLVKPCLARAAFLAIVNLKLTLL